MDSISGLTDGYGAISKYGSREYDLSGVGDVPVSQEESTSSWLAAEYKKWLGVIKDIMDRGKYTPQDIENLQKAVNELANLAKKGDTSTTPPSYMQPDMLEYLNVIFALMNKSIVPNGTIDWSTVVENLKVLKSTVFTREDGSTVTFDRILNEAYNLSGADRSLQSMLYADFVLGINKVYDAKLEALEAQLQLTKKIAELLAQMQDFRNGHVHAPGTPGWIEGEQKPTAPTIDQLSPDELLKLVKYRDELNNLINQLKGQNAATGEGSLIDSLQNTVNDLNNSGLLGVTVENFASKQEEVKYAANTWLGDGNWFVNGNAGKVQDNISKAITATESLERRAKRRIT